MDTSSGNTRQSRPQPPQQNFVHHELFNQTVAEIQFENPFETQNEPNPYETGSYDNLNYFTDNYYPDPYGLYATEFDMRTMVPNNPQIPEESNTETPASNFPEVSLNQFPT